MKATWNNTTIAEADSEKVIYIEGNMYFPPESVHKEYVEDSSHTTTCVWKGEAHYFNVVVNGEKNENAAWYYPVPKEGSVERVGKDFSNYIAFWNGVAVE